MIFRRLLCALGFYCFSFSVFSSSPVVLNEQFLKSLDLSLIPTAQKSSLGEIGSRLNKSLFEENFSTKFNLSLNYGEDKSRQLNRFVPVTSPTKMARLGFQKNTIYGASLETNILAEQFSNNFLTRSTTVGAELKIGLDLYKDIFGRSTRKKLKNLSNEEKVKEFESRIFDNQIKINFLKLYWSLVANQESINITQNLIEQAKKQVRVTEEKVRNSVSDKGTLARMKSILSSRQGSLNSLHYQKSNILRSFRELIPNLSDQEIVLGKYNITKTIGELFKCTDHIEKFSTAPLEETYFDDISKLLQENSIREKALSNIYDDVDFKLIAQTRVVGKDFSYDEGLQNLNDDPRLVTQVGIQFSAPIGPGFKKTAQLMNQNAALKGDIIRDDTRAKLNAFHIEILRSVKVLKKALKNQNENTVSLKESLLSSRLKFSQARIGIEQLVGEEDAYFVSELNNIGTNLSIIHTMLDYYSVFNLTECSLKN